MAAKYEQFLKESANNNDFNAPIYLIVLFMFANFISQGALLFNFGFALSNKKRVISKRKFTTNLVKKTKRRDTFLSNFGIGDDDSDEDEDNSWKSDEQSMNPFKMGRNLEQHLEKNTWSPVGSPLSDNGSDDGGSPARVNILSRFSFRKASTKKKSRRNTNLI